MYRNPLLLATLASALFAGAAIAHPHGTVSGGVVHPHGTPAYHPTVTPVSHSHSGMTPTGAGAKPTWVKGPTGSYVATGGYASSYGVKLRSGYFAYKGHGHRHWGRRYFSPRWNCWVLSDPSTDGWYYWCGDRDYYLPVRYLTTCPPTQGTDELPPESSEVPTVGADEIPDLPEPA